MHWINERNRLPFQISQIQQFDMPQPVVLEEITSLDRVQIPAQIDQEPNS